MLTGVSRIGSGLAAIRGGKSAVTGIGVSGAGEAAGVEWSTRELEDMTPDQQVDHANMTGAFLMLMGTGFLAMIAYVAWGQFREYRAAQKYQAMAEAAGLISSDVPAGTRLTVGSREVCWTVTQSTAECSDSGLTAMPRTRGDTVVSDLVSTPRGLVLASNLDVTWLETSDRMLYFRSGGQVKGIRIDAPPL